MQKTPVFVKTNMSYIFCYLDLYRYYEGLHKCLGLHSENTQYSSSEVEQLEALYKSLVLEYSWSSAAKV